MTEEPLGNIDSGDQPINDQSDPRRERIKHLLVGSPKVVKRTIQSLHVLGYCEVGSWSKLQSAAGSLGDEGEVVSVLMRYVLPE